MYEAFACADMQHICVCATSVCLYMCMHAHVRDHVYV
jgi:hypothetical protein